MRRTSVTTRMWMSSEPSGAVFLRSGSVTTSGLSPGPLTGSSTILPNSRHWSWLIVHRRTCDRDCLTSDWSRRQRIGVTQFARLVAAAHLRRQAHHLGLSMMAFRGCGVVYSFSAWSTCDAVQREGTHKAR